MTDERHIITELARKYGYSYEVIKEVVQSPFKFMYKEMSSVDKFSEDEKPEFIIPMWGKFALNYRYRNKEKNDGDK